MIKYCTQCGSKVEYNTPIHDTRVRAVCVECQYVHYENPNIIAGVLPVYKDEILLCKRSIEPKKGMWTIPSGFLELNETVEEGALREAKEEAGIDDCHKISPVTKSIENNFPSTVRAKNISL